MKVRNCGLIVCLVLLCIGTGFGITTIRPETTTPENNQTVRYWIETDDNPVLLSLNIKLHGNAEFSSVMTTAEGTAYGWDDTDIGFTTHQCDMSLVSWTATPTGTVGHFDVFYENGVVIVSLLDTSSASTRGTNLEIDTSWVSIGVPGVPPTDRILLN